MIVSAIVAACGSASTSAVPPAVSGEPGQATNQAPSNVPSLDSAATVEEVLAAVADMSAEDREAALLQKAEADGAEFVGYFIMNAPSAKKIADAFIEAYPTMAEQHLDGSGGIQLERILDEASAGRHEWDVAIVNPEHISLIREADLMSPYSGPTLEEIPDAYRAENGEWVDLYTQQQALMYNTDLVATPPTSLEDLTDPQYRGKFTMDPEQYEWFQVVLETLGEDEGLDLMQRIKANDPVIMRGGGEQREAVANGEVWMAVSITDYDITGMTEEGTPVDLVYLEEVNVRKHGPMVLSKHGPNPAAAVLFFDWALSLDGQQAIHDSTSRFAVHPDVVDTSPELAARRQGIATGAVDLDNFAENYAAITAQYQDVMVD